MRTFLIILIFSVSFISNISAQKVKFGIIAGPVMSSSNKSNFSGSDPNDSVINTVKNKFSFFGGVVASIPVSNSIVFKPQLQYITKGWVTDHAHTSEQDFVTKMISHWIELPLNFAYNVPAKNGRFFFGLGPYVSYAISAKMYDDRGPRYIDVVFTKNDTTNAPAANRVDVGANIMAEYEFKNGIFIALNYSHGFIDFRNDIKAGSDTKNRNMTVGLGIGYMFK